MALADQAAARSGSPERPKGSLYQELVALHERQEACAAEEARAAAEDRLRSGLEPNPQPDAASDAMQRAHAARAQQLADRMGTRQGEAGARPPDESLEGARFGMPAAGDEPAADDDEERGTGEADGVEAGKAAEPKAVSKSLAKKKKKVGMGCRQCH